MATMPWRPPTGDVSAEAITAQRAAATARGEAEDATGRLARAEEETRKGRARIVELEQEVEQLKQLSNAERTARTAEAERRTQLEGQLEVVKQHGEALQAQLEAKPSWLSAPVAATRPDARC